jgi:hypothetical protein
LLTWRGAGGRHALERGTGVLGSFVVEDADILEAVLDPLRIRVLNLGRKVLLWATAPTLAAFALVALADGRDPRWLVLELLGTLGVGAGLQSRLTVGKRAVLLVAYLVSLSTLALAVYGPTIGTGLFT